MVPLFRKVLILSYYQSGISPYTAIFVTWLILCLTKNKEKYANIFKNKFKIALSAVILQNFCIGRGHKGFTRLMDSRFKSEVKEVLQILRFWNNGCTPYYQVLSDKCNCFPHLPSYLSFPDQTDSFYLYLDVYSIGMQASQLGEFLCLVVNLARSLLYIFCRY